MLKIRFWHCSVCLSPPTLINIVNERNIQAVIDAMCVGELKYITLVHTLGWTIGLKNVF